ncbi:MAG: hypothetical protein IPJ90_03365 [Anaerolineaceae bacterium]|nr:hypothetical protein [Anaerolineaceae bacterium]
MSRNFWWSRCLFGTLLANTRADAGAARPDIWELAWASVLPRRAKLDG